MQTIKQEFANITANRNTTMQTTTTTTTQTTTTTTTLAAGETPTMHTISIVCASSPCGVTSASVALRMPVQGNAQHAAVLASCAANDALDNARRELDSHVCVMVDTFLDRDASREVCDELLGYVDAERFSEIASFGEFSEYKAAALRLARLRMRVETCESKTAVLQALKRAARAEQDELEEDAYLAPRLGLRGSELPPSGLLSRGCTS